MKFFENWWTRAPQVARIVVALASIGAITLGGAAGHYWT
jgi:hypothetical protein